MTYSYVPGVWLWRMVIILPLLVILPTYAVTRDAVDLVTAIMVFTLATPLNGVMTNVVKLCVGRPRPDFVFRCWRLFFLKNVTFLFKNVTFLLRNVLNVNSIGVAADS